MVILVILIEGGTIGEKRMVGAIKMARLKHPFNVQNVFLFVSFAFIFSDFQFLFAVASMLNSYLHILTKLVLYKCNINE